MLTAIFQLSLYMPLTRTYLCGLAAAAYITTCLVVAAVRWFHMCQPYNRDPKYYYPGRPFVTCSWLGALTLLPYLLDPESPDAWFLVRLYFLPVTLYHFVLILFSYFGSVMQWKRWMWPTLISGVPVILALLAALILAIIPGNQTGGAKEYNYIFYILGVLISCVCLVSTIVILIWAKRFNEDDFSNPADFPVTQARKWMAIILINTILCWTAAIMDSPAILAILQLLISASCVIFVITALHPNRNRPVEELTEPVAAEAIEEEQHLYHRALSNKRKEEMMAAIRTIVEEREAYLEPHLTLQDVAQRTGYNRTYISGLIKTEFGGFFNYINHLRLNHVDAYIKENPDASVGEAAEASGFGSRQAYYTIRKRLEA